MIDPETRTQLRALLERDRVWSAYALADLDPKEDENSTWFYNDQAVVLIYHGLDPAVLFAYGEPEHLTPLLEDVLPNRYIYLLKADHKASLGERLRVEGEAIMYRMILRPEAFPGVPAGDVGPLSPGDRPAIEALFADHPDRPDAYHPRQLHEQPFFGIWEGDELVSVAGIHITSTWAGVAAVGNVFTRPDRRGQGLGTRATGALVADLLDSGVETIVLNVSIENAPAIRSYRKLGFEPHCQYHEGIGYLNPSP